MLSEIPGVHVTGWASDGSSAAWALQQEAPDAVVLDINLGQDNGLDILSRFREAMPVTKFIIFTNYAHSPMRRACMKAGADHFFDKSNEFQGLVDVLTRLVAEQELEHEYSGL